MCRGVYIHYLKSNPSIFCCPLFSENYFNPKVRINKMVNKHTVNYHASTSQLITRIHPLIFLWTPKGFISPESWIFFPRPAYFTLVVEKFHIYSVKITDKCIYESKNWICSFLLIPPSKTLPQADGSCPFLLNCVFWRYFYLSRKGEGRKGYGVEKIKQNKTRVLVTTFDTFHNLCNLHIFCLCSVVQ